MDEVDVSVCFQLKKLDCMFDFLSIYYTTAYANPWFHKNEKKIHQILNVPIYMVIKSSE